MVELRYEIACPMRHVPVLAARMRPHDREELIASHGADVEETLRRSIELSTEALAAYFDEELACVFGVAPVTLLGDVAAPWLIGTQTLNRNRVVFTKEAVRFFAWARETYPVLVNHVDARNTPSIAWLKRVGFTVDPPEAAGVFGLPFHRFHMGL